MCHDDDGRDDAEFEGLIEAMREAAEDAGYVVVRLPGDTLQIKPGEDIKDIGIDHEAAIQTFTEAVLREKGYDFEVGGGNTEPDPDAWRPDAPFAGADSYPTDYDMRQRALELAVSAGDNYDAKHIVQRAETFRAFLAGEG